VWDLRSRAVAPLLSSVLAGHMISQEALPSGLVTRCLDLLRTLSSSERDLIRVVVEVVHELRDANDDDEVIVRPSSPSPTTESP
jgi:condensin complex subunit 3